MSTFDPTATITLKSNFEGDRVSYSVELETKDKIYKCLETENYNKALACAIVTFKNTSSYHREKGLGVVASCIDEKQGRGTSYSVGDIEVPENMTVTDFYQDLTQEFEVERFKLTSSGMTIKEASNKVFKQMMDSHKLNEYQEEIFLHNLKSLDHVE